MLSSTISIRLVTTSVLLSVLGAWGGDARSQDPYEGARQEMVESQLRRRGIRQQSLLNAMETVPRHLFIAESARPEAYADEALPPGAASGDGLLQPYMTALMIELLSLDGSQRVLEIGTGTGYDAAVLSRLASEVYTVEISSRRGEEARDRLAEMGFENVHVRIGDGKEGWPSQAPFDAIILTTAPEEVPRQLLDQLHPDGTMVVAVGSLFQELTVITKSPDGEVRKRRVEPVRMEPMSVD